jgi:protocatechuate 3,4-dioxygenase beta subunit
MTRVAGVWVVVALLAEPMAAWVGLQDPQGIAGGVRGRIEGVNSGQMPARPGPRQAEDIRGTSVIRGSIVAADSGSAIRRAQVRISGQGVPSRLATTDAQGRFEIKELPAGRYTVSALKAGFVTLQYGQRRPSESGTPIDLGEGQILEKLVIGLPRGSVITGRITDEFGEPLANAMVTALRYGYAAGAKRLMPGGGQNSRDTTDDQGQFRLFGLSPGEYVVSAALRAAGDVTDPSGEATGYPPTYYPGTANVAEAQRVNVAIGQEQNSVSFGLIATRLVRVTGAVIDSQGGPVRNGMVMLAPAGGRLGAGAMMQMTSARVSDSGQFRLANVAPGRYVAQVRTMRGGPGGRAGFTADGFGEVGRQEIAVGGDDLDGVVIVTGPGARATGVVTMDGQSPIRAQQVQVGARLAEPEQAIPGGGGGNARINDDWTFEMNGLFDARLFRVGVPQGWTLKSVTLNGQDITDTPIELPPGQTVTGVQIAITDKVTSLSGRITDIRGNAVTDVTVVVFPADETRWTYQSRFVKTSRPGQDGQYQMSALPPYDRYLAVAVQGLEDGQAGDPEFLASIKNQGTDFSLNDGETRAVDLRFRPR